MKVILKKHVPDLGEFGAILKVADGYARNFLLPKGYAVLANENNIKSLNNEKEAYLRKVAAKQQNAEGVKQGIEALSLVFKKKAAEDGRLFGSVTVHDILSELKSKGFELEKKDVGLNEPIKAAGPHQIQIRLHPAVSATVQVIVETE
ncbi:MAG: 50S ribosomal protein L9 [Deltaproteobacteria bacterium]